jgi:tetratricopeptide (TPR) repeat protein
MNRRMPHSESTGAAAPQPSSLTPATPSEQERPLQAADDRAAQRADRTPDALQQARDFAAAGETAAAITTLRALIAREPRHARARGFLAELLEKRGDTEGALGELGRALDVAPDDVVILCQRALLLTTKGRYDQAEADLRDAVRVDAGSADVQLQLGVLFCKRARWREAIEPLRAAVASAPDRVQAHYYLGDAYNSIDELPSALSAYQAAAALDPTHHRALQAIGIVLDRLRRPNDAAIAYQRAREAQRR